MSVATFFEANAGTGKTRRLTDSIAEKLLLGVSLERVCAVTFTDKAATEMIERLSQKITGLVNEGALKPKVLEELDDCFIGTIHGFCHQILKRYGERIGLPPLFQVDDQGSFFDELFEARWDSFISDALKRRIPPYDSLIPILGIESLELIASILAERRYRFSLPDERDSAWLLSDLRDPKRWGFNPDSRWPHIASNALAAPEQNRDLLLSLADMNKLDPPDWKDAIRDALNCRTTELHTAIDALQKDFVDRLLNEYRSLGYRRFEDLIIDTRNLLRNHPEIRRQLKARYELVLVDEMQDTDPVQYEIFLYLCEKNDAEESFTLQELITEKKKLRLQEGKLFVVGDPKQSIYGFRKADLNAYQRIKEVLHSQAVEVQPLVENHRSCCNIVDYTNSLAAALFSGQKPKDSTAKRADFCEGKKISDCVHLINIDCAEADALHLRVLAEANWLAEKIKELTSKGDWSYSDIGILLRKLTNAHLYIDALCLRGIPVVVEGEKFFFQSQEVIDFLNLLKYIVDEMDSIALAGLLRSPLFGLNDFELAAFFANYSRNFDAKAALEEVARASRRPEVVNTLIGFLLAIQEIRADLRILIPGRLMDEVLKKFPVLTVATLAYGPYRSQLAPLNILKIHKEALAADSDPVMTPYRFVKTFESYSKEAKEFPQEAVADEGTEAVRVMSIHKSKGLDFPVVFVPLTDYGTGGFRDKVEVLHDWESDSAGIWLKNGPTEATYLRLKYGSLPGGGPPCPPSTQDHESLSKLAEEERRVIYVAATRAKKQLYFCYTPNVAHSDSGIGDDIFEFLHDLNQQVQVSAEKSVPWLSTTDSIETPGQADLVPVMKEWASIEAARKKHSAPQIISITTEARAGIQTEELTVEKNRSGTHALLVGLICHAALENIDYRNPGSVSQLVDSVKWKFSDRYRLRDADPAAKESVKILENFLHSAAARWLASVEILGRELPVSVFDPKQNKILTGAIDLLIRDGEKHCIIDYKSNLLIEEGEQQIYRNQMLLYTKAVQNHIGAQILSRLCLVRSAQFVDLAP